MSIRKPQGLLPFLYNTTCVSAYRVEMHMDMHAAFDRFRVHDTVAQRGCFSVERAAYDIRRSVKDAPARLPTDQAANDQARKDMAASTDALFPQLALELTELVVNGFPVHRPGLAPDQALREELSAKASTSGQAPPFAEDNLLTIDATNGLVLNSGSELLLEYLYYFFYFPVVRKAIMGNPAVAINPVNAIAVDAKALVNALVVLDGQLGAPREQRNLAAIAPAVEALCSALALEYRQRGYLRCW